MVSRRARNVALMLLVATVAACGLPRSGPNKSEIFAGSVLREGDAFIVSVNDRVTRATSLVPALGFSDALRTGGRLGADTINPGDILTLTIYENVAEGLLANQGENATILNEVQVDSEGFIFVPYAGRIRAAGSTPDQLREAVTRQLDAQTPDPQVAVRRVAGDGSTVSVLGTVGGQGVYPIQRPTRTLAAMLANAGGVTIEPDIAQITVTRGNHQGSIWLTDLYDHPVLDIALRNGDRILVKEDSRRFVALGATGTQSLVPFRTRTLSAIEAIAQVGGLNPNLADPTGVFIFRNEPSAIANAVLGRTDLVGDQRFAYVLDLTQPTGMFMARDFAIRDGDTVYVTEAPFSQWQKTIAAITGQAAQVNSLRNLDNN
jgi:polysaccharide export outer membrane protein